MIDQVILSEALDWHDIQDGRIWRIVNSTTTEICDRESTS